MGTNFNGTMINQSVTIAEKVGADIADVRNLILKYDEDGNVVIAANGTAPLLGLSIIEGGYNDISGAESGKVKKGDDLEIQIKDIGYAIASAEIKKGQEVTATTGGKAAVAKAGEYVIGVALNSVSAGGYSRIQIAKYQKAKARFRPSPHSAVHQWIPPPSSCCCGAGT